MHRAYEAWLLKYHNLSQALEKSVYATFALPPMPKYHKQNLKNKEELFRLTFLERIYSIGELDLQHYSLAFYTVNF